MIVLSATAQFATSEWVAILSIAATLFIALVGWIGTLVFFAFKQGKFTQKVVHLIDAVSGLTSELRDSHKDVRVLAERISRIEGHSHTMDN